VMNCDEIVMTVMNLMSMMNEDGINDECDVD